MSAVPVMLHGDALCVLVVGGGTVATRRAIALLDAGAEVRVVAPDLSSTLRVRADRDPRLTLAERPYAPGDIGDAVLVLAATDSRVVNACVAADARRLCRLANVADVPGDGNCSAAAAHHAGDLTIAIGAGGVPRAAVRIRDELARRFDGRYTRALDALRALRATCAERASADAWREAQAVLVGEDFCASVEDGRFDERMARWR